MAIFQFSDTDCDEVRTLINPRLTIKDISNDQVRSDTIAAASEDTVVAVYPVEVRNLTLAPNGPYRDAYQFTRRSTIYEAASRLTSFQRTDEEVGRIRERFQEVDWEKLSIRLHNQALDEVNRGRELVTGEKQALLSLTVF